MGQIANYNSLFEVHSNPKYIIENVISSYFIGYKSSTYYLNDLTRSFKYTLATFQRISRESQIDQLREKVIDDIKYILG